MIPQASFYSRGLSPSPDRGALFDQIRDASVEPGFVPTTHDTTRSEVARLKEENQMIRDEAHRKITALTLCAEHLDRIVMEQASIILDSLSISKHARDHCPNDLKLSIDEGRNKQKQKHMAGKAERDNARAHLVGFPSSSQRVFRHRGDIDEWAASNAARLGED